MCSNVVCRFVLLAIDLLKFLINSRNQYLTDFRFIFSSFENFLLLIYVPLVGPPQLPSSPSPHCRYFWLAFIANVKLQAKVAQHTYDAQTNSQHQINSRIIISFNFKHPKEKVGKEILPLLSSFLLTNIWDSSMDRMRTNECFFWRWSGRDNGILLFGLVWFGYVFFIHSFL